MKAIYNGKLYSVEDQEADFVVLCDDEGKTFPVRLGNDTLIIDPTDDEVANLCDYLCTECYERPCTDDFRLCEECEAARKSDDEVAEVKDE
jgi:hypothetical protein